MRSNLPRLKRENQNGWYWARDLIVNGITVGRGGGNITTNVANGYQALKINSTGNYNTASGTQTLQNNSTGSYNTASGFAALQSNTTGSYNTASGCQALLSNTTGANNTASGGYALTTNTTGANNTASGYQALTSNYTGVNNTSSGMNSMYNNITGSNNLACGMMSMYNNTTSSNNTANGYQSAFSLNNQTITAGSFVVGASYKILTAGTTDYTLIGAANSSVGTVFIATGIGSGTGTATLNHQTSALGYNSSYSNLSGHNVTALGVNSLYANTTFYNVTGVGANSAATGNNQVILGDGNADTYVKGGTVQSISDMRDKTDIRDTTLGLAFIESLRPVDYRWDKREDYRTQHPLKPEYPVKPTQPERVDALQLEGETEEDYRTRLEAEWQATLDAFETDYKALTDAIDNEFAVIHAAWLEANKLSNITHDGTHKRNRYHHGVIAQEVPADFGGLQYHAIKGGDDAYSVGYEEFIAPLIKAVQELSAENKILKQHLGI